MTAHADIAASFESPPAEPETLTLPSSLRKWPRDVPAPSQAPPVPRTATPADRRDRARPAWVAAVVEDELTLTREGVAVYLTETIALLAASDRDRMAAEEDAHRAIVDLANAKQALSPLCARLFTERARMHRAEKRVANARAALTEAKGVAATGGRKAIADALAKVEHALAGTEASS